MKAWLPAAVALWVSGCSSQPIADFQDVVGCYRAGDGSPVLDIRGDGRAFSSKGQELAVASLRLSGGASVVGFQPGLVISDDNRRLVMSGEPQREHLINRWRDEIVLYLERQNFAAAATPLTHTRGQCQTSGSNS